MNEKPSTGKIQERKTTNCSGPAPPTGGGVAFTLKGGRMTTEEKIWQRLKVAGYNDFGIAGMMGNLYAESALSPTNLQNAYEKKLGDN